METEEESNNNIINNNISLQKQNARKRKLKSTSTIQLQRKLQADRRMTSIIENKVKLSSLGLRRLSKTKSEL